MAKCWMNPAAEIMLDATQEESIGKPLVQVARDYEIARVLTQAFDGKDRATATVDHGVDHLAIQVLARVVEGADQQLPDSRHAGRDGYSSPGAHTPNSSPMSPMKLRTPLTSIRAMVETLEGGAVEDTDIAQDFLARIVVEIERLTQLLDDLLDFARLESGRTPLRLDPTLAEILDHGLLRLQEQVDRAGLTLIRDYEDDLPEVVLDVGRIEQVLLNLVHNAIKFTPEGGTLTLHAWRDKNKVLVSLKDTGVGIPEGSRHGCSSASISPTRLADLKAQDWVSPLPRTSSCCTVAGISVKSTPGEGSGISPSRYP